ncbi:MAG: T9SS type A sorting domain-containing protein [Bacteroidetes bacterium]|nr:T9SS type A sorting domain-containing protein [Bacteroidota bacterium]
MFITSTGVNDTIPDPVNLTAPADNSVNISNTQSFSWTTVADAVLYTAEFATDSLFTNIVLSRTSGTNSSTASALPGSSTYYWRVKSNNGGHESVYSPYWKFTTVAGAATLTSPPDSSVNVFINPVFEWQAVPGADNYQLQVATASTFILPSIVYNQSGLTNTSQQIPALNANTRYYWRVRSYTGSIAGYYSTKFTFLTGTATGIQHLELTDMITAIYPNPATDFVYADIKSAVKEDVQIIVRDMTGKAVYTDNKSWSAVLRIPIDVSGLQKGYYILELKNGNKFSSAKFLVE